MARVTLVPDFATPAVGSTVVLRVTVEGAKNVASVPFHLLFNPNVLEYRGAVEGSFLAGDGQGTVFMVAPSSRGRLVVGHSRLTRVYGISGAGELCSLSFVAVGKGDAGLAFDHAAVIDNSGNGQPASFEATPVEPR
jgi:general secretion pathway protein D